jgi:hypothetical protein
MAGWAQWASPGRASKETPEGPAIKGFRYLSLLTSHHPQRSPLFRRRVRPSIRTQAAGDALPYGWANEDGSIVPRLNEPELAKWSGRRR